jgi:hypothetical protein
MFDLYKDWSVVAQNKYTVENVKRVCKQLPEKLV